MKMGYAHRVCWDADSHLMPRADFLSRYADPELAERLLIGIFTCRPLMGLPIDPRLLWNG